MRDFDKFRKAVSSPPDGITEAEINIDITTRTTVTVSSGQLSAGGSAQRTRIFVRAGTGQMGITYSENIDEDPLELIRKAAENSRFSTRDRPGPMNGEMRLHLAAENQPDTLNTALTFGIEVEKRVKEIEAVDGMTDCTISINSRKFYVLNSRGLDVSYERNWSDVSLLVKMRRAARNVPGFAYASSSGLACLNARDIARKAAEDGQLYDGGGLPAISISGGDYPAVLTGRTMRNIMMTAWREFAGTAMLSGESIFSAGAGAAVGSEALTITNCPVHRQLGQGWPIDSEGTICTSSRIVSEGMLITPLHTLETALLDGRTSTGSAGRIDRMTGSLPVSLVNVPAILFLEPGSNSIRELTENMGTGFLLTYSLDLFHSVNIAQGDFSIPCGGVYYEQGNPVGFVSNISIAGNLKELWSNIAQVGNDLDFDDFYLKSYTIGSPSVLVRALKFGA